MQSETLMTRIMDKLDKLSDDVKDISERAIRVEDTVKRHDEFNFPKMDSAIEEIRLNAKRDAKIVEDLCRVVSRSDGRMNTMEADILANSKANKMFSDMATTWKVGKWAIGTTVSFILFLISVKSIIHGGIKDGLNAINNLLF